MSTPGFLAVRRVLSLPILAVGAFFLVTLSFVWWTVFDNVSAGLFMIVVFGGLAAVFLAAGFALWGRTYLGIAVGLVALGVGVQVGLMAIVIVVMLSDGFGDLVPSDFDTQTSRSMAIGSSVSAVVLLGVATVLLAQPVIRVLQASRTREKPILVWVVLVWQAYSFVAVVVLIPIYLSGSIPLNADMQQYLADKMPYGPLLSLVVASLSLVGSIFLVRLRKLALWLFVAAFALGALGPFLIQGPLLPPGYPASLSLLFMILGCGIEIATIAYVAWLFRRNVLG